MLFLLPLLALPWLTAAPARAADPAESTAVKESNALFEKKLALWTQELDRIEARLNSPAVPFPSELDKVRTALTEIESMAAVSAAEIGVEVAEQRALVDALGPPPAADQPPEPEAMAQSRERLMTALGKVETKIRRLELVRKRATQLLDQGVRLARAQIRERLLEHYPVPIRPTVAVKGLTDFAAVMAEILAAPFVFLARDIDIERWAQTLPATGLAFGATIFGGFLARHWLQRRWPRDPAQRHPSPGQRMAAQLTVVLARGLLPAAMIAAPVAVIHSEGLLTGLGGDVLSAPVAAAKPTAAPPDSATRPQSQCRRRSEYQSRTWSRV